MTTCTDKHTQALSVYDNKGEWNTSSTSENKEKAWCGYVLTEYRILYGTRVLYEYTRMGLGLDSISLNVRRTWKVSLRNENNVVPDENSVEGNHV